MSENMPHETRYSAGRTESIARSGTSDDVPNDSRPGSDWSLASVAIGAIFTVSVPPTLSLLLALDLSHWATLHPKVVVAILGYLAGIAVVLLLMASTVFGLMGMAACRKRGHSIALGFSGFLLSAFNVLLWIVILLAWHGQVMHRV
jgi:hypothetical protein